MKMSDFLQEKFVSHGQVQLTEWVINGEYHPIVKVFHDSETNEGYQVSEKHKKFRKTPSSSDRYLVQKFGEWEELE